MIRTRDALLEHLNNGGRVRLEMVHEPEPKRIWTDAETGESVHGSAARWALQEGKLQALSDGLFQDAPAQTFELAQ